MSGSPNTAAHAMIPGAEPDSCLDRIRQSLGDLDGVRLVVAKRILHSPWAAFGLSIAELAELSQVSENAVNRFARSVGYSGYREFSQALSFDLGRNNIGVPHSQPIEIFQDSSAAMDDPQQLVSRVFELEVSAISDTARNLDRQQVQQAVDAMTQAGRIVFVGTGSAAPLCQMAQYRCSNLGLAASWASDPMVMVSEVSSLGPADVVLAITYSGQGRAVLETLDYAREKRGATTIALTASQGNRISDFADICLVVFGPEVSAESGQFAARTAGMILLEAIITAVGVARFGPIPPTLDELSDMQARINSVDGEWIPARLRPQQETRRRSRNSRRSPTT